MVVREYRPMNVSELSFAEIEAIVRRGRAERSAFIAQSLAKWFRTRFTHQRRAPVLQLRSH